ncbi:MAG: trimethylamine methyltransferase family protein [Acidimicrobiia bacterium]|nr:trimethylamine methyltransferase family protein [Acidimicrobiia bacterium]
MSPARRGRRGRRARASADRAAAAITQPLLRIPPYEVATAEQVAEIHDASMRILEEAGIAFYDDEAHRILTDHGVAVDDDGIARFDRALVEELVEAAPAEFTHLARNPERSVVVGGDHIVFAPVAGPPFVEDRGGGRREGTYDDLVAFVKMTQTTPYLHCQGTEIVVPNDVAFHERGLDIVYAHLRHGDKPIMGHYPVGVTARDSVEMARIVFGAETVESNHVLLGTVNVSSPRRLDDRMLGALIAYVRANQPVMITPFVLAGAMGPASILGSVAQANAEALAGVVFAQMVRPGVPVVYGPFLATVDLQSGSPVMGSAESTLAQFLASQMARRYELPFRAAGGYTSGKRPDGQSGIEAAISSFSSLLSKPNFVLHAAGWMENGLTTSYEKFALDLELLGVLLRMAEGVPWGPEEWAFDAVLEEVPPGGHHLGTAHTLGRFRTAFHRPDLFDYDSFETWNAAGAASAEERAARAWRDLLDRWEDPGLDEAVDEELHDYMERRRREIDPAEFQ